jgi:hypothetical protein
LGKNDIKESIHKTNSIRKGYKYVPLKILEHLIIMHGVLFENVGVAAHPSDLECKT